MPDKRCTKCKVYKDKSLFYKNNLCNRCKIIDDVRHFLDYAKLANHFNTDIDEIKYILDTDIDDPNKEGGEHSKYDNVMLIYAEYSNSQFNNIEAISRYLDE